MAGLAEKVKDSLRSRSRHRYSVRARDADSSDDSNHRPSADAVRRSGEINDDRALQSSPVTPAWHIHRGTPTPSATPIDARSINGDAAGLDRPYRKNRLSHHSKSGSLDASAPPLPTFNRQEQRHSLPPHDIPFYIPQRKESLPPQRRSTSTISTKDAEIAMHNRKSRRSMDGPILDRSTKNGRAVEQHTEQEQSSRSSAEIRNHKSTPSQAQDDHLMASVLDKVEHLRLPADFDLGHSEKTVVDVEWRPAVTHENIYHHQTEIIQEAITRDIHVHHYYTYVQPIRVVEVLPPKHYRIDEMTGEKYEIPTPPGWVMPVDMQPRPVDTSMLKATTRHYLVDEQNPRGIPEAPPADFDDHVDLLEPTEYGVWTM